MGWQFLTLIGLRSLVFLVTSGALGCHIANIILFTTYAKSIALPAWSAHLQYIFYLIALGLSFICSLALLITFAFSLNSLRADKYISIVNTIVIAGFLIYNTIKMSSDFEPWVNNTLAFKKTPNPGFMTYCSAFQSSDVPMGSNLFLRCWLINGLWLGMIVSCVAWVALGIFAWTQHKSEVFDNDDDDYHYKSDVPLVPVQSPTISYNNAQAYSRDDPYDRGLTTSPAAKAAATYGYNNNKSYDNYNQSAAPKYADYNTSKPSTPAQGYSHRYDGNDGYVENYVPYRRQDDVSPGAQTQASKFQDDDADDYYGTSTPELSPKRYQSPHTATAYGGGSPGYQNTYGGGYQNSSYDYRSNNRYPRNNSYE
ncbi:hypothetical protein INT44_008626 [Umbelopsis vinacea]|uniref:MARVEL domain-containing protein n=1 Tax=Umbelopsis vinacea TaxID=44442 RepID=A0A8H7PXN9_9FUNG|nr:hypothetical protein INT44_008626 [Umbelopsis vinacea]